MRFKSGKIRAAFVDEPSSALDPEGELQLCDNLRKERQGKTMIFVTHRFEHLTGHADLIMYAHPSNRRRAVTDEPQMYEGRAGRGTRRT